MRSWSIVIQSLVPSSVPTAARSASKLVKSVIGPPVNAKSPGAVGHPAIDELSQLVFHDLAGRIERQRVEEGHRARYLEAGHAVSGPRDELVFGDRFARHD